VATTSMPSRASWCRCRMTGWDKKRQRTMGQAICTQIVKKAIGIS
jgi:hypothetical protein